MQARNGAKWKKVASKAKHMGSIPRFCRPGTLCMLTCMHLAGSPASSYEPPRKETIFLLLRLFGRGDDLDVLWIGGALCFGERKNMADIRA